MKKYLPNLQCAQVMALIAAPMLVITFATSVAGYQEIFAEDNFADLGIRIDNVEVTAEGVQLLAASESWVQAAEVDFELWMGGQSAVAVDSGGVRLASTSGGWFALENAPYSSSYGAATVGTGRYVFILRGYYSGVMVGVGRYDTTTESWESWSDPAIEWQEKKQYFKNGCSMVWDNGGYIYVLAGGSYNDIPNPSDPTKYEPRYGFWRFRVDDPSIWTRLEDTPWWHGPGGSLAWVRVDGENYIYAWLGTTSRGSKADPGYAKFYRYHITASAPDGMGKWEAAPITEIAEEGIPEYPYGADDGSSLVWTGGDNIYYMPGAYNESLSGDAEFALGYFVISENRWVALTDMPLNVNPSTDEVDGVDDGGSVVWSGGGYIYVLKGGDGGGETPAENFYRYSISGGSWEVLANVPAGPYRNNGQRLGYAGGRVHYWRANSTGFWAYEPPQYEKNGWFESGVFDAGATVTWRQISWQVSSPAGVVSEKKFVSTEPLSLISGEDRLGLLPTEDIATHVVISEVSPTSDPGEYVEFYNPTDLPIDLSGWYLNVYRNDYIFGAGDVIPAHGYFLISDTDPVCGVAGDAFHDLGMADDGASSYVQLRSGGADGPIIDQVGWGASSIFEGALASSPGSGKSLERKSGATHGSEKGNGYDTCNNANDFLVVEPNPQNRSSPGEIPPAYSTTYLDTQSKDGVYEEISEGDVSTPVFNAYHEEDTVVVSGVVSSGSPDDLDANDRVYYEVDAAFAEGGSGTETLYEAITVVENGTEASGTSTNNLDADDGVYYEADAVSSGDMDNWHLLGGTDQDYPGMPANDGTTHYKDLIMNPTDEAAESYGNLPSDRTLWWYEGDAVTETTEYQESSWTATIYREGIEDDEVGHTIYADVYKVDGAGNITHLAGGSYTFSSSESAGSTAITCTDNAATEQTLNPGERVGLRLKWTCSTDQLRVYWYKSSADKFSTLTSPQLEGGTYSIDLRHNSGTVTTSEANIDNIQVTLNFRSSATATYHFDIWNFNSGSWESWQSGSVGTGEVTWTITKTSNPGYYVDDSTHVIRVRLWTTDESSAHRPQVDYLVYKVNYATTGIYSVEVRHDSAVVPYQGVLGEIQVALNFKSSTAVTYHFEIYNFNSSSWESGRSGSVGASEATWTITKTTGPADYISSNDNIRVRLRTSSESSAHRPQVDYLGFRVSSAHSGHRLRWEHRLTDVESTLEDCVIKVYGYNATGDENVIVGIWRSDTNGWETIGKLPPAPGEITHTLTNIGDYLVGSQMSIKFEDADDADATRTKICIDYIALEARRPYSTVVRVKVRGSPDNVTWPDWASVPYVSSGHELLYEIRYLQYRVELSTEDSQVTPILREFRANHCSVTKASTGTFTSQPLCLGYVEDWGTLSWDAALPENTSISFATRSSAHGSSWSDWQELDSGIMRNPIYGCRYLQVRATFRGVGIATPTLYSYNLTYKPDRTPPEITLSEPKENFLTDSEYIILKGRLDDFNPVTLEVNGKLMLLKPGSFEVRVELSLGQNTIHLVALDAASNRSELALSGTYSPPAGWVKWASVAAVIGVAVALAVLFVKHKER